MDGIYKTFLDVILGLLLAFAFFSRYFIRDEKRDEEDDKNKRNQEIGTPGLRIFIIGIMSIIALVIFYYSKLPDFFAVISITPFFLIILFVLVQLYIFSLKGKIKEIFHAESHWAIFIIIVMMILIWLVSKCIKSI